MEAEERAEGTPLKPAHDQLPEIRAGGISSAKATNVRRPVPGGCGQTRGQVLSAHTSHSSIVMHRASSFNDAWHAYIVMHRASSFNDAWHA